MLMIYERFASFVENPENRVNLKSYHTYDTVPHYTQWSQHRDGDFYSSPYAYEMIYEMRIEALADSIGCP